VRNGVSLIASRFYFYSARVLLLQIRYRQRNDMARWCLGPAQWLGAGGRGTLGTGGIGRGEVLIQGLVDSPRSVKGCSSHTPIESPMLCPRLTRPIQTDDVTLYRMNTISYFSIMHYPTCPT